MREHDNSDLVGLLGDELPNVRTQSLQLLSEGYASDNGILERVLRQWDELGVDQAYPEFPMLTFLPLSGESVAALCERSREMTADRKLTDLQARCGGKLLEHLMQLPARELADHVSLLETVVATSKIYFRVDIDGLKNRIRLLSLEASDVADELNQAIADLMEEESNANAVHRALHALEVLRTEHPNYIDLQAAVREAPGREDDGQKTSSEALSFQLALQSLVAHEGTNMADVLATHLSDPREAIYSMAVEALVRQGDREAAATLGEQLLQVGNENQELQVNRKWMARGLQRIRVSGAADMIASVRDQVTDGSLWLMLLVAEVRQFDANRSERLASELGRLNSYSELLIDSLYLFTRMHEDKPDSRSFQGAFMEYLTRVNAKVSEQLDEQRRKLARDDRRSREKLRKKALNRLRDHRSQ